MPLLTSPIDGSPMRQINRYGIEIDVCPTSGGTWLDKGELEKLTHMLREEAVTEQNHFVSPYLGGEQKRYSNDKSYPSGKHSQSCKKESKMSRFMDLFDF